MSQELTLKLMKTFDVNADQAARLLMELKQCVKRKNLVRILKKLFFIHFHFKKCVWQWKSITVFQDFVIDQSQCPKVQFEPECNIFPIVKLGQTLFSDTRRPFCLN